MSLEEICANSTWIEGSPCGMDAIDGLLLGLILFSFLLLTISWIIVHRGELEADER